MDNRQPVRAALRLNPEFEASYERITGLVPKVVLLQKLFDAFLALPFETQVRMLAPEREPNKQAVPTPITHEVTRILDPEITPPRGEKLSDRQRAKRAS